MGILIAALVLPSAWSVGRWGTWVRIVAEAYIWIFGITVVCSVLGLAVSTQLASNEAITIKGHHAGGPACLPHRRGMHNASYLGGILGAFIGAGAPATCRVSPAQLTCLSVIRQIHLRRVTAQTGDGSVRWRATMSA